jgi:hypothetical protein
MQIEEFEDEEKRIEVVVFYLDRREFAFMKSPNQYSRRMFLPTQTSSFALYSRPPMPLMEERTT